MAVSYKHQWGTLFLILEGKAALTDEEVLQFLGPWFAKEWETPQRPSVWRKQSTVVNKKEVDDSGTWYANYITAGPYKDLPSGAASDIAGLVYPWRQFHVIKWNLRRRDRKAVTLENTANFSLDRDNRAGTYRKDIMPVLQAEDFRTRRADFLPYGMVWKDDKGVPKTPALPAREQKTVPEVPGELIAKKKKISPWAWVALAVGAAKMISG